MDVDTYIETHQPEWDRLATACARGSRGLARLPGEQIDEVVRLYLRVSGHLAEAQTRYRDPRLSEYLNQIVSRAHGAIYSADPRSVRSIARIFGSRYRQAIRRTVPFILVAAAILVVVSLATAVWVAGSREVQAGVLPPAARRAVRRAGGAATLGVPPLGLSTRILVNNVQVALLSFALGVLVVLPTVWILSQNAVLLGSLAGAYAAAGKSGFFWSLILPHGILELTAICIAAGAGMRIGWAFVDPGDRGRGEAVTQEARDAILVVIGVVPAFVIAAGIEGFLTPTAVPGWIKIAIGAAVAAAYIVFLVGPGRRGSTAVPTL